MPNPKIPAFAFHIDFDGTNYCIDVDIASNNLDEKLFAMRYVQWLLNLYVNGLIEQADASCA